MPHRTMSLQKLCYDNLCSYYAIVGANMQERYFEIENVCGRQCRQAVQTRPCGGIPADLTFFLLFWSSKKVEKKNMNGRPLVRAVFNNGLSLNV